MLFFLAAVTLHGPFATAEAACGDAPLHAPGERSAFCQRLGVWQVTLRDGDEWFIGPLPVQDGVRPLRVDGDGPYLVRFSQHSFSRQLDEDGEWAWPCAKNSCGPDAVPVDLVGRYPEADVETAADVVFSPGGYSVVFWRLRIGGESPRSAEWRARVARLRGHHDFSPQK